MNREIKFRAWDLTYKKMWNVETLHIEDDYCRLNDGSIYGDTATRKNRDIEIMQYTGLTDKNGVEIYEGDILKITKKIVEGVGPFIFSVYFDRVEYRYSCGSSYRVIVATCSERSLTDFADIEVIGNIYDNPELLNNNK